MIHRHLIAAMALLAAASSVAQAQDATAPAEEPAEPAAETGEDAAAEPAEGAAEAEAGEATAAAAEGDPNVVIAEEDDGRYYTADGVPTFKVENGVVDWLTYSGYRRYHAECHVCHGPDGEGSTYAPAIKDSAANMDYYDFYDVVVNGRGNGNSVMPSFGDNANVMCYLDDIYVYLKARGTDAIPRGRPPEREDKSASIGEAEDACLGG